jgi:hypothetical protein
MTGQGFTSDRIVARKRFYTCQNESCGKVTKLVQSLVTPNKIFRYCTACFEAASDKIAKVERRVHAPLS